MYYKINFKTCLIYIQNYIQLVFLYKIQFKLTFYNQNLKKYEKK